MIFNRNRDYNYFKIFLAVFLAIISSIVVYFIFLKFNYISEFVSKIIRILTPVIIGIVFAYLFNPIISWIEKRLNKYEKIKKKKKLGRILSIIITYLIFIILIVIMVRFFIPNLLESLNTMVKNVPIYLENLFGFIRKVCMKYNINDKFIDTYRSEINNLIKDSVVPNLDIIINNLASGITSVIRTIINIVISFIISIYLLYDKESFSEDIDRIIKAYSSKETYNKIIYGFKYVYKVFGGFMVARLIDSLIIGIITFIVLSIFKIPYAFIISFVVGVTNVIPFFGPFIGAIPSIILLLIVDPTKALEFGIIILIIQQFDGNILGPKLIGNKIGIKSFWILFAILLFGGLFGFIGMIIAVPLFACIYEFLKNNTKERLEAKRKAEEEAAQPKKRFSLRRKKEN